MSLVLGTIGGEDLRKDKEGEIRFVSLHYHLNLQHTNNLVYQTMIFQDN